MFRGSKTYIKYIGALLLGVFAFISIVGIYTSVSRNAHIDPVGYQCPKSATSCQSASNHTSNWGNAFLALASDFVLSLFFLLGLFVLLSHFFESWKRIEHLDRAGRLFLFRGRHRNFFLNQLSDGILQPIR